ncbi:hypothetical protein TNCT_483181 [Trichonephila clavata]|uniref:Uncharacterized protein n=1 Tax=Trichonephila clavata TaxID=2740835 RepID=A0A8X6GJF0_TRICU|nr:hypothetical protein TNCT_483181 [Trichonephila clavata]
MDFDYATTNSVTPDNSNRNAGESGSSRTWNTRNQAYGNINTGTDPLRFQSRGYRQSHMVRFNERQFNNQPRQFVQHNQHNFRRPEIVKTSNDRMTTTYQSTVCSSSFLL